MKEENKKKTLLHIVQSVFLVLITASVSAAASYLYLEDSLQLIRNTVMAVMGSLLIVYIFFTFSARGTLDYHNEENFTGFSAIYYGGLLFAVLVPALPATSWPYIIIFLALAFFSNMECGIASGSVLLMITMFLSPSLGMEIFVLYFMSGLVTVSLFQSLDEDFRVGIPVMLSLGFLIVCETANSVLFVNEKLSIGLFVIPVMNVLLSAILLIALLKVYSYFVIHKYRDLYQTINDQEYPLMVELKEKKRDDYYHVIHAAYLSDRIAKKLHLNEDITKAASYYLRIGALCGENTWENVRDICISHKFPPEVLSVLQECLEPSAKCIQKETAVVLLSDAVITYVQSVFLQDKDAVIDYVQLIDKVFRKKIEAGVFKENLLTYSEVQKMRKTFVEEKLYYDFLR